MRRVLDSVRAWRDRKSHPASTIVLPPPPLLPLDRPRPITPSSPSASGCILQLGSLSRLPLEIRRQILIILFGDRALHLDLRIAPCPQVYTFCCLNANTEHGRGKAPLSEEGFKKENGIMYRSGVEHEWQWYGCVCHRAPADGPPPGRIPPDQSWHYGLHKDSCLFGIAEHCQSHPRLTGIAQSCCDYTIGALGWLLTCRQAYVEGTAILYGSNTFILESADLIELILSHSTKTNLGHVILPRHLAMIKSLELIIDTMVFKPRGINHYDPTNAIAKTRGVLPELSNLKARFPNLRSLTLSFPTSLYADYMTLPTPRMTHVQSKLLNPLAEAFAPFALIQKHPFVVELPLPIYQYLSRVDDPRLDRETYDQQPDWLRYPIHDSAGNHLFYYIRQGADHRNMR